MNLALLSIIIDTSLVILIWIVQLVVYPSFCYYSEVNIKKWHPLYTTRITVIVLPLMLSQLVLYSYFSFYTPSFSTIGGLALVGLNWLITFLVAIPLHRSIDERPNSLSERKRLVTINWSRTLLWTLILIINLINYA